MKTNLGLTDEARLEVGQILNLLLADESVRKIYLGAWSTEGAET